MQLFYDPSISKLSMQFSFDKEESRHIVKVLRKKTGDILHVTNGSGWLFTTEIILATEHKCNVKITESAFIDRRQYHLHLAVAPTKMNDRYEWFLEKATEIGIDEITPLLCDRSERKILKVDRMEKILVSAMKQSGQYYLPKLNEPVGFSEFISSEKTGLKAIAHCLDEQKQTLKNIIKPGKTLTLLIGPEGDFTKKEIEEALLHAAIPVALGSTRLRTETAGIVAATLLRNL
ncbi:MAG: 16S rRNA (uracil(1498)-N(3))-methyltransferase [Chitinophagaceae bacterium]|nr:MAG: 16S rRNA (uracil(1498)-N(3))-methyltransferase [Chitinophagaceae bacterium]